MSKVRRNIIGASVILMAINIVLANNLNYTTTIYNHGIYRVLYFIARPGVLYFLLFIVGSAFLEIEWDLPRSNQEDGYKNGRF